MSKSLRDAIHDRRRILQNPYAYVDELEEMNSVRADRRRLENPYAHIDKLNQADGAVARFDGLSEKTLSRAQPQLPRKKNKYSEIEIERHARDIQRAMWRDRSEIFAGDIPNDPLAILDPSVAFQYLGYAFELSETLGQFNEDGRLHEVAGTVDQQQRRVQVSAQFPLAVRNFTAAHELGHALLHETVGLHRDRPLSGVSAQREQREFEADKFATFFLMPRKLVISRFEERFGQSPFTLNQETGFALMGSAAEDPRNWPHSLRALSKLLASVTRFNGREIVPLAVAFRVSVEAMAIRLEELNLVAQS